MIQGIIHIWSTSVRYVYYMASAHTHTHTHTERERAEDIMTALVNKP